MIRACLSLLGLIAASASWIFASEVEGKITLQKNLTRRTVAATVYDFRGIAVPQPALSSNVTSDFDRIAVWLESSGLAEAHTVKAVMEQHNRSFEPELLIVPIGSTVEFPNADPIFHNIFSLSKAQSFDLGYYPQGRSRTVTFKKEGVVQVYCHVHPNMYGVIVVANSPWAGKPRRDGTFSWADVPAGKYKLMVWQRSMGIWHKNVTVPESGSVRFDIDLPKPAPED